jgi:dihydroxyacetone kinase-like predicted kinase
MKIKYIDGKRFIRGIKVGAYKIVNHQDYLNKINVFPVPDADTGTNMAATMKTIVDNIQEDTNQIDEATKNIANSALEGARGNSGVILAQFFYGLAKGSEKINVLQPFNLARLSILPKVMLTKRYPNREKVPSYLSSKIGLKIFTKTARIFSIFRSY